MEISHRLEQEVLIINLSGNLALDESRHAKEAIRSLLDNEQFSGMLLNFKEVNIIDSGGISMIVALFKDANVNQRAFRLCGLSANNKKIIDMLSLQKIMEIVDTESEALSLF